MIRTTVVFCIVGVTPLVVGCGSYATVTGTVTYKGQPIPSGYIVFHPESGARLANAPIIDGVYNAEKVATGPAKVTITSLYMEGGTSTMAKRMGGEGAPPEMISKMGMPPSDVPIPPEARERMAKGAASFAQTKKGLKIPDRYGDPELSGLTYAVEAGQQTKDFKLE
jgi:hypothetical protein